MANKFLKDLSCIILLSFVFAASLAVFHQPVSAGNKYTEGATKINKLQRVARFTSSNGYNNCSSQGGTVTEKYYIAAGTNVCSASATGGHIYMYDRSTNKMVDSISVSGHSNSLLYIWGSNKVRVDGTACYDISSGKFKKVSYNSCSSASLSANPLDCHGGSTACQNQGWTYYNDHYFKVQSYNGSGTGYIFVYDNNKNFIKSFYIPSGATDGGDNELEDISIDGSTGDVYVNYHKSGGHRATFYKIDASFFGDFTKATNSAGTNGTYLTEEDRDFYAMNNIVFYEPCGNETSSSSGCDITVSGATIEEKIWSGLTTFMSDEQAAGVMGNMANEGGFNPARHETKFLDSASNYDIAGDTSYSYGIGLIQWSYGRRTKMIAFVKSHSPDLYTKYIDAGRDTYGRMSGADFLSAAGDADTNVLVSLELCYLKQELLENKTYNGVLETKTVEEASDYFLSHIEVPADIPGNIGPRRQKAQKYYEQFHGKTIAGTPHSTNSLPSCSGQGNYNIAETAWNLAWPPGTPESQWKYGIGAPTEEYKSALDEVYPGRSWGTCPQVGASCDVFVGTVVRYAGVDKEYARGLDGVKADIIDKGGTDIWEVIKWDGSNWKNTLQNGDILWYSKNKGGGHTLIFIVKDGKYYRAEAGLCSKYGRIQEFTDLNLSSVNKDNLYILRAKNAVSGTSTMAGTVTNTSEGNHDLNADAIAFAWPEGTEPSKYDLVKNCSGASGTEAFMKYFNSITTDSYRAGGGCDGNSYKWGASCSVYVATVIKYAGFWTDKKVTVSPDVIYSELMSDEGKALGWEEVDGSAGLQPGDVLTATDGHHAKMYVEQNGKQYIAEAHNGHNHKFAALRAAGKNEANGYHVLRNKNNTTANSECNMCSTDGSEMGLKLGGLSLEEAKKWMQTYRDEAKKRKTGSYSFGNALVSDAGCFDGTLNNCVAFSQWFLNKYTSLGPNWDSTTNGDQLVSHLKSSEKFKTGTQPRPYAIFSTGTYNHTGVVVGVTDKSMIVAEASCSNGFTDYWPGVSEWPLSAVQSKKMTFAYTDDIINLNGVK